MFDYDEQMGYTKKALYDDDNKIYDWEFSFDVMDEYYSYIFPDGWEAADITIDNTIYVTTILDKIEEHGGSYKLVTVGGKELTGESAENYLNQYGFEGVDLFITDVNGAILSGPAIRLYTDELINPFDTSNMQILTPEVLIPGHQSPYNPNVLPNWNQSVYATTHMKNAMPEPWEVTPRLYWNTHGGETMSILDTRLGVIGTSTISFIGDAALFVGAVPTTPTIAGGAIVLLAGLNIIDDVYYFVNALGSPTSDYQNFTSYSIVFPGMGIQAKTGFSLAHTPGRVKLIVSGFKTIPRMNLKDLFKYGFEINGFALDVRGYIKSVFKL
jgi:hypothetical protein